MSLLNAFLRTLFDALLAPFRGLHPLWGLAAVSLVIAIGMLLVFKWTSNQKALETVKRRIHASLFEIRLFNDDFRAIFRAQFDILRHNLHYVSLSLVPLLWMIVPLVLVMAQLQFHYGYKGLELGQPVLLKVELKDKGQATRPNVELQAPSGIKVEAGPVWIPAEGELAWRIAAEQQATSSSASPSTGRPTPRPCESETTSCVARPCAPMRAFSTSCSTGRGPAPRRSADQGHRARLPPRRRRHLGLGQRADLDGDLLRALADFRLRLARAFGRDDLGLTTAPQQPLKPARAAARFFSAGG
ncbi:MAG: hypothetical protein HC897_00950 [Thermoanaerobaculia bacterium]|nr:hypothetical protein [Thermoanaerobaculia bacterium]